VKQHSGKQRSQEGFVLVEAISALAVAGLAATALFAALGSANARSAEARVRSLALRQAQVLLLETVEAPLPDELARQGAAGKTSLAWRRTVEKEDETLPGLQKVAVEVNWSNLQKKGVMRLEAYRAASR
jgi:hypothetical protein